MITFFSSDASAAYAVRGDIGKHGALGHAHRRHDTEEMMLLRKTLVALAAVIVVMALLVFGFAGTIDYWQGWVALGCYGAASLAITLYLARYDPALLRRRMRGGPAAEHGPTQRIIMSLTSAAFIASLIVPGLDHRFGWSAMPDPVAIAGDIAILTGFLGILWVFRVNSYASATIERAADQRVISTGPYAIVRHPMYTAALLTLFGLPIGLGSWWGALVPIVMIPVLAWRALDEERFLRGALEGYAEYCARLRWRLIPFLW